METLYTVDEAAEALKVHPKTVREWLRTKRLNGVLAGRFWRIKESDLQAFLREPEAGDAGAADEEPPDPTDQGWDGRRPVEDEGRV
jgi:excisionase family DNA binding protein